MPLDLDGVSRGAPLDKLGQRALNQGEIFFDDVRIPAEYMVVGNRGLQRHRRDGARDRERLHGDDLRGRRARGLEHALAYAKERVQGGVPIFEHQNVKSKLFKMFARSRRRARWLAASALQLDPASRWSSTRSPPRPSAPRPPSTWRAGAADLRRQRAQPRVPDREAAARRARLDDRRRLQRPPRPGRRREALTFDGLAAQGGTMELRAGHRQQALHPLPAALPAGRAREDPAHARGRTHRVALGQRAEPARGGGVQGQRARRRSATR